MPQKMFNCPVCGHIVEAYGMASNVNCDMYVSYDLKGNKHIDYGNHDVEEFDGWYCGNCDSEIDISDVVEVDDYDDEL